MKYGKHSVAVLTAASVVGMTATAIAAAKAAPKAAKLLETEREAKERELSKLETVRTVWAIYLPAALIGLSTAACIVGTTVLNKKQQASIASAYALVSQSFGEYKEKVKALYGEEAHEKVLSTIAAEKCKDVCISSDCLGKYCCLDFDEDEPKNRRLFFDYFSNRYFETTVEKVIQAEYHLNRNFMLAGVISLNDFYTLLGLKPTEYGSSVGWSQCDGDIYWIDFHHTKAVMDDGLECCIIEFAWNPDSDFLNDI